MKTMLFHWVPFFFIETMKLLSSSEGGGGGSGEVLLIPPFFLPWHFSSLFLNKLVQYTSRDVGFFFSFGQWRVWEEKLQKDSGLRKGRHRQPGDIRGTVVLRARNQWKQPRRRLSVSSAGSKSDLVRLSEVIKPEIYQTPPVTSFSRNPRESSHTEYESSLSLNLISRLKQF